MNVTQYLQHKVLVNYTFDANAIAVAILPNSRYNKKGLNATDLVSDVPKRELDLSEAELWEMAASLAGGCGVSKKVGDRSYSETPIALSAEDRLYFRRRANELRSIWGIKSTPVGSRAFDATIFWK